MMVDIELCPVCLKPSIFEINSCTNMLCRAPFLHQETITYKNRIYVTKIQIFQKVYSRNNSPNNDFFNDASLAFARQVLSNSSKEMVNNILLGDSNINS